MVHQHGGSRLGAVNLPKTFQQISEVWDNAETLTLEKCFLYLSPVTSLFGSTSGQMSQRTNIDLGHVTQ